MNALTFVKLAVVLLGLFNLFHTIKKPAWSRTLHLEPANVDVHMLHVRPSSRTLITEESVRYGVNGTQADLDWASLVPQKNYGLVTVDGRPYAVTMFHTLHCLDRIRRAIVGMPGPEAEQGMAEPPARSRYHVRHCFNYVRQMVLCAANTRLNPINHVLPNGNLATDGIGIAFECRDWNSVYDAFERNAGANDTMRF